MRPVEAFLASLPDAPRVLDAGCGDGLPVLRRLQRRGAPIGLDSSRGRLRSARRNVPGAALVRGELRALPLAAGTVDAVLARDSIVHVPVDDHAAVIVEFARVLGAGGRLLLSEGRPSGASPRCADRDPFGPTVAGLSRTREQLHAAGLTVEREWPPADGERGYILARVADGG